VTHSATKSVANFGQGPILEKVTTKPVIRATTRKPPLTLVAVFSLHQMMAAKENPEQMMLSNAR